MKLQNIYFSATGNTRKIVGIVGQAMNLKQEPEINLTEFQTRTKILDAKENLISGDLFLFGCPVYRGKIPSLLIPIIKRLEGKNRWIVIIVVNGNIHYDRSLEQLAELLRAQNFKILGGGKFIGAHSFNGKEYHIAEGRPNSKDIHIAKQFGMELRNKLNNKPKELMLQSNEEVKINENTQESSVKASPIIPKHDPTLCLRCRECYAACPTEAIDFYAFGNEENPFIVDPEKCIMCAACVKICPVGALSITLPFSRFAKFLFKLKGSIPKQPKFFI
ncbi:MAG: EFR1 family ferrodoxin [Promethearchaeota archaeon]